MDFQQAGAAAHMPQRSGVLAGVHLQGGNGSSTLDVRHSNLLLISQVTHVCNMLWRHLHSCPCNAPDLVVVLACCCTAHPPSPYCRSVLTWLITKPSATADPAQPQSAATHSSHNTNQPKPPSSDTPCSSGGGGALRTTRMLLCSLLVLAIGALLPRVRNAGCEPVHKPSTPTSHTHRLLTSQPCTPHNPWAAVARGSPAPPPAGQCICNTTGTCPQPAMHMPLTLARLQLCRHVKLQGCWQQVCMCLCMLCLCERTCVSVGLQCKCSNQAHRHTECDTWLAVLLT